MKSIILAAVLAAAAVLAGCAGDGRKIGCASALIWLDCSTGRTPAEVDGGSE